MRTANMIRRTHYWASLVLLVPVLIVIGSGVLLLLKKEFDWIQPPTQEVIAAPEVSFETILSVVKSIPEMQVTDWSDIDRLDVRPEKGIVKVRGNNLWEAQLNLKTGEVLQLAYRRTDVIESIHDGSWFHSQTKLWVFLPAAFVLLFMTLSGTYLFVERLQARSRKRKKEQLKAEAKQARR